MTYRKSTRILAHLRALLFLPALVLAGPSFLGGQTPAPPGQPQALTDLRMVMDTGVVLQDRNGDRVVDDLELRILLGPEPTEAEVAAGANLAARLACPMSGATTTAFLRSRCRK